MSPKNTTLDQVFEVVQTQGQHIREVLEAVQTQGKRVDTKIDTQFTEALEAIHLLGNQMDERFEESEQRFFSIESQMVTKTYLDDKLADLRGDLTLLTRHEDQKLISLVDLLFHKRLMTKEERQHIIALQPFAAS